ncbi:MAG: response regulator [Myxococcales bacterium]|nr:response regulator [Myxococcales bacterium]
MQVLLLTIDPGLAEAVAAELGEHGVECSMEVEHPDAIIVDAEIPDAAACVARLDADELERPILYLVGEDALSLPPDGVAELVVKPPRRGELWVRLQTAIRRGRKQANPREALALMAVEAAGDIVEIASPDTIVEYVNPAFVQTLGYTYEEIVGKSPATLIRSDRHDAEYFHKIDQTLARGETWKGLLISRTKDGELVYLESAISPIHDREGRVTHHIAVKRDITQRLRAENELRRINAELEQARDAALEASRAKSQFLANMSHELRTPLNAIIGYSEMLAEDAEDTGDQAMLDDLRKIRSAGAHLLALINDVLDLSKVEAGAMKIYVEAFDLRTAISGVLTTIAPMVTERSNELRVSLADDLGLMRADLTKVRQALLNLLSNACKFTEHGRIELRVQPTELDGRPFVRFEVSDTGIGISSEQLKRLFRPFVQADASTTRRYGGTGLGLAISLRFCEMMGGSLEAESTEGEGSVFRMLLPRAVKETGRKRTTGVTAIVEGERPAPQVLVIDDDPMVQDVIGRALMRHGFKVAAAHNGRTGLQYARERRPDAIVLDVMMPGLDGRGVLTSLKGDPETAEIPVVMLTILEQSDVGFALGAADFLIKPVRSQRLATVLHRYCRSQQAQVLVIDDDPAAREIMRRTLESSGHRVTVAENGQRGIAALRRMVPDLVLLDLMMPVMDGFGVLEYIRGDPRLDQVPVVVVTAKDLTPEDRAMLRDARAVLERTSFTRQELVGIVAERVTEVLHHR